MMCGISKIRSSVFVRWTSTPFKVVVSVNAVGSGISSAVTNHGPMLPVPEKFLPTLQALISAQVELIGASNIHLWILNRDHPQLNIERKFALSSQGNGIGIRKDDTELLAFANTFVAKILANGQLNEINQRWFGTPLAPLPAMPKL